MYLDFELTIGDISLILDRDDQFFLMNEVGKAIPISIAELNKLLVDYYNENF